jgi:hypothetical protein
MKKRYILGLIIILIALLLLVNLYFFSILGPNDKHDNILDETKYQLCLHTTNNPDKIRDDYFMVQYNTTLSESEIANHILKMGFNYSSIKITNDYYLITMNNEKIKRENPSYYISEATNAEFAKFSKYILNHSSLITLAIRNPKGIMAMKVEFQRDVPPEESKEILDKIILDYDNDEVWSNEHPYYFNERQSWAHIIIPEGSGITEVEGYCKFLMEEEIIGAQLVPDIGHIS